MHRLSRPRILILAVALLLVASACGGSDDPSLGEEVAPTTPTPEDVNVTTTAGDVIDGLDRTTTVTDLTDTGVATGPLLAGGGEHRARVVGERGHDNRAWTQGLEFDGQRLYESRGEYGESAITEIDPVTGEVLRSQELSDDFFAEGLTFVDDRIIVLTWREQQAFVFDAATFETLDTYSYEGEGWGLCYDGASLYMSDGTDTLTRRDPDTFEPIDTIAVTLDGQPVSRLNELECINGQVWANVWQTDAIVVIDPTDGTVVATIDGRPLRDQVARSNTAEALNGIAFEPRTGRMLLAGKDWPSMFEVEFDPCEPGCVPDVIAPEG